MSNRGVVAFGTLLFAVGAVAGEIFVDAKNGLDGDGRGGEAAPYLSIQAAVDAARAGDTITLLPGDYTNGVTTVTAETNTRCRVVIDKKLTIRSKNGRASRDVTRIIGAWDVEESSDRPYGMGPNAIRCVWVTANATGTRFEGITFLRGSALYGSTYSNAGSGGGVMFYNSSYGTIVDCAFVECQGWRGGGAYCDKQDDVFVVARTLFRGCRGAKFGYALRGGAAYNCVFDDNRRTCLKDGSFKGDTNSKCAFSYAKRAINCTFVNNEQYGIGNNIAGNVMNCLFVNNSSGDTDQTTTKLYNCVNNSSHTGQNCVSVAFTSSSEVYSPFDGDYRLIRGAKSLTAGNLNYVDNIAEEFRSTDYYGNPRTTDGKVYCGAVQDVAAKDASGIAFTWYGNGDWHLDGKKVDFTFRTFVAREGWPVPYHVKFVPQAGRHVVRYIRSTNTVWPMMDDTAYVMSSSAGKVQTMTVTTTEKAFWTDPEIGDDDVNDGSESAPFKTLNKAVNAWTSGSFVVYAKPGDYKNAEEPCATIANRVVVKDTLKGSLRVKAISGSDETFITGAADPTGANGLGTGAIRCVAVASTNDYRAAFQGFTLRDGHSLNGDSGWSTYAGGLHNTGSDGKNLGTGYLVDCTVKDCTAARGAALFGGTLIRCRVENCFGASNGVTRKCNVYSSLFQACRTGDNVGTLGEGTDISSSTMFANRSGCVKNDVSGVANCVLERQNDGYSALNDAALKGDKVKTSIYNTKSAALTFPTSVLEDPVLFADKIGGDYSLQPSSAGASLGEGIALEALADVDGTPFAFDADGHFTVGCFALHPADVTRYVDADHGNDANDGTSEATAFQTLAKALAGLSAGDTVIALPGTYDAGAMLQSIDESYHAGYSPREEPVIPARAVLKPGVRLVSRDGAATTVIRGDENVRGVFLGRNAYLKGFTVTGASLPSVTQAGEENMTVNDYGAGICGYAGGAGTTDEFLGIVENCVICGNQARSGSGVMYGTYRNCVISNNVNKLNKPGYAARAALLEGCFVAGNGTTGVHSTLYDCDVYNCTVMGGQAQSTGSVLVEGNSYGNRMLANSLVLATKIKTYKISNCVFGGKSIENLYTSNVKAENCVTAEVAVAASGAPLANTAACVDAGDSALLPNALQADVAGNPRVLNGRVDVGAYEYDWRVDYSQALAKRRVVVTDVPANAMLANGRLTWTDAEPVNVEWASGGFDAPYEFTVTVAGVGTLTVLLNGGTLGTYGAGTQTLKFESAAEINRLTFVLEGEGTVALSDFIHKFGLAVIVR